MQLDDIKAWLRVDGDDDDQLIQGLMDAAAAYLRRAIAEDMPPSDPSLLALYETATKFLVASWYEDRNPVVRSGNALILPMHIQSIILQLRTHVGAVGDG